MTRAQAATKAATPIASYRCEAKLGKDRCTLGRNHNRPHQAPGPTGAILHWSVTSEPPLKRKPE